MGVAPRLAAARAILTEPRASASAAAKQQLAAPLQGRPAAAWREYLAERGWLSSNYDAANAADQQAGLTILSTSLTFPLTLARHWPMLEQADANTREGPFQLCVVGSRAESTLPVNIWKELAILVGVDLHVSFVGPKAAPPGVPNEREWTSPDGTRLHLSLPTEGELFHRSEMGRALLKGSKSRGSSSLSPEIESSLPHAFVLFNPGTGEDGWEKAWSPTMRALSASRRPLLMTALSVGDAARDDAFLAEHLDAAALAPFRARAYKPNPFASLAVASAVDGAGAANFCARVVLTAGSET